MEKKLIATRDGLGDELVELGGKNKNIYVVDADTENLVRLPSLQRLSRSSM